MKLAVILGVLHMMLGIFIRIINTVVNKKWLQLFTLAIPQLLFLMVTFLYMDFLIIFKWNTSFSDNSSQTAPSIISTMIGIYVGFG